MARNAPGDGAALPVAASRTRWWLWPHLLSLDAPLVAVLWQRWWAGAAGIRLDGGKEVILGLGVWMIYLGDRLADTASGVSGDHPTARHRFYGQRRRTLRPLAAVLFLGLAWVTPRLLPVRQLVGGLGLLAVAGGYFWLIHRRAGRHWSRVLPKEAIVGAVFAAGTAFFVLGQTGSASDGWLAALPLFGVLCFCNCALITRWERNPADVRETSSLLNAFPGLTAHLGKHCVTLALLASVAAAIVPQGQVFVPIATSALLLAALNGCHEHCSLDALRVLADAALLTPAIGLILPLFRW